MTSHMSQVYITLRLSNVTLKTDINPFLASDPIL